jgi:hypothetical protein
MRSEKSFGSGSLRRLIDVNGGAVLRLELVSRTPRWEWRSAAVQ